VKRTVLIVAEGEHELSGGTADAALPILVRRLLGDGIDLRPTSKRIRELSGHVHAGRGNPLARKFIGIIRFAERQGFDAVVILVDQDDDPSRHNAASVAQETTFTTLPRAIGIAVRSFDAWFLVVGGMYKQRPRWRWEFRHSPLTRKWISSLKMSTWR
jgi:hypothetical protein